MVPIPNMIIEYHWLVAPITVAEYRSTTMEEFQAVDDSELHTVAPETNIWIQDRYHTSNLSRGWDRYSK